MDKWEYCVLEGLEMFNPRGDIRLVIKGAKMAGAAPADSRLVNAMRVLGDEGWELVTVFPCGDEGYRACFKRQIRPQGG